MKTHLIFGALRMVFQEAAAAKISKMILKFTLLSLYFEQRRFSSVISHDTLHLFQIRLYSSNWSALNSQPIIIYTC
jgi:hypothetical protein